MRDPKQNWDFITIAVVIFCVWELLLPGVQKWNLNFSAGICKTFDLIMQQEREKNFRDIEIIVYCFELKGGVVQDLCRKFSKNVCSFIFCGNIGATK